MDIIVATLSRDSGKLKLAILSQEKLYLKFKFAVVLVLWACQEFLKAGHVQKMSFSQYSLPFAGILFGWHGGKC